MGPWSPHQTSAGRDAVVRLRAGAAPDVVDQPCVSTIAGLCRRHRPRRRADREYAGRPPNVWVVEPGWAARAPCARRRCPRRPASDRTFTRWSPSR